MHGFRRDGIGTELLATYRRAEAAEARVAELEAARKAAEPFRLAVDEAIVRIGGVLTADDFPTAEAAVAWLIEMEQGIGAMAAEARVKELESSLRAFDEAFMLLDGSLVCDCGPHLHGPCGVCMLSEAHDHARRAMRNAVKRLPEAEDA